jgi:hypothetical protein
LLLLLLLREGLSLAGAHGGCRKKDLLVEGDGDDSAVLLSAEMRPWLVSGWKRRDEENLSWPAVVGRSCCCCGARWSWVGRERGGRRLTERARRKGNTGAGAGALGVLWLSRGRRKENESSEMAGLREEKRRKKGILGG